MYDAHDSPEEDAGEAQFSALPVGGVDGGCAVEEVFRDILVEDGDEERRERREDKVEEGPEPIVVADLEGVETVDLEEEEDGGEHDVLVEGELDEGGEAVVGVVAMDDQETAEEPGEEEERERGEEERKKGE